MNDFDLTMRCQRCGHQMELHDPEPGQGWAPQQYWFCASCGRHFWTTYPPPETKDSSRSRRAGLNTQ